MRRPPLALFSGIGRRIALAAILCGLAVFAVGLLLQTGKQHRQHREMQQQLMRMASTQAARLVTSRLGNLENLLKAQVVVAAPDADGSWATLRSQLQRLPQFESVSILPPASTEVFNVGSRTLTLDDRQRDMLLNNQTVLVRVHGSDGAAHLYLLRELPEAAPARLLLAGFRESWLWSTLLDGGTSQGIAVFDSQGRQYYGTGEQLGDLAALIRTHLQAQVAALRPAQALAWTGGGEAWTGSLSLVNSTNAIAESPLGLVVVDRERPLSVAFWSALRTQSTALPLLLLLAAWLAHRIAAANVHTLRQLRRALSQLPDRRIGVTAQTQLGSEVRQLVEAYNRAAEAIETQNDTRRVLDEIDALLLPGGEFESVIDQVLYRVRTVTRATHVGLTLVDPGVAGHGRLFVVSAQGGSPVNRVVLDEEMVATLREAESGMTVVRCEEGRHSFLEPLQAAGSGFFWVWPVVAAGELAAILAVGYPEQPAQAAGIADTGTQCAQRLGLSLSSHARADRLYRQAHFDPLTQLPNRQLFRDELQQALRHAVRSKENGALLFIDLDHFKRVNDSLGHEAGDQLLSIFAQRLRACVKDEDTVARLGGDEFTVILRDVPGPMDATAVADRIIHAMQTPVRLGGRDHHVQASIGITMFPADGVEMDALLHNADLAMYRAKDLGRGGAAFYNPKMSARGTRVADSGMYRAMKRREFSLYFQPQYRVEDGSLAGVEALLRWQRPSEGLLTSAEFVPAAEESGLIIDLGGWVIEAACAQIAKWRDEGLPPPRMAVNLSVQQLRDPELVPSLRRQLERYRLAPEALEFEVNEAALVDPQSQDGIAGLSAVGVGLTLDDFGTGSTALANLRRYPVGAVKIDRSYIEQVAADASAAALASTIIVMAHSLQKRVIAEGVETLDQLDYLRERGCDAAQGYFLARPLSAADMTDLLRGRRPEEAVGQSATA